MEMPMSEPMQLTDELKKAVQDATSPDAIRDAMHAELARQVEAGGADEVAAAQAVAAQKVLDAAAAAQVAADAENAGTATTETPFSRTEIIGGREFTFEAATELELERLVNNAFKVAYAVQDTDTPEVQVDPVVARANAEKAAADDAAAKVELELRFKRGEISTADYIEQSGAMKDYLAKQGVPLDELRNTVEESRNKSYELSWQQATEQFLHGPAGSDWPGGPSNLKIIGLKIAEMGLVDATDKVAALAAAYNAMKQEKLIFKNDEVIPNPTAAELAAKAAADAATAATAAATATAAAASAATRSTTVQKTPQTASGFFGASSGVGEGVSAPAPKGDVKIDPNATPEQILAEWKTQQLAAGKNPDQAFMETFGSKR